MSTLLEQLLAEVAACPGGEGITSLSMVTLPENVRRLLNPLIRKGPQSERALAETWGLSPADMRQVGEALQAKGMVTLGETDGMMVYRVWLARTRELRLPPA